MGEGCGLLVRIGRRGHFSLSFSKYLWNGQSNGIMQAGSVFGWLIALVVSVIRPKLTAQTEPKCHYFSSQNDM